MPAMPDRTGIVATPNRLAQQERFRPAAVYGKAALADPESRELYEDAAGKRGIPVFSVTLSDFLNAPAVDEIDLSTYTGKAAEVKTDLCPGSLEAVRSPFITGINAFSIDSIEGSQPRVALARNPGLW